jgi:hypothetical protein
MSTEVLQQLDLSQGTLGQDLLAEDIGDLLDRDALSCGVIMCRTDVRKRAASAIVARDISTKEAKKNEPDNAVCALAELLGDRVATVHDEILAAKDLEDLAVRR